MDCRGRVSTIHPGLSIPELIKLIKHSFRECEFDEVQNGLMEREKNMKLEIEELVRDRDSLKKEIDLLEKTNSYTELEKCGVEEKLGISQRRCQELDKEIVQMGEMIRILRGEKLGVEEKLEHSNRKGEDMDERLLKMEREIEVLRREKLDANRTIEELKQKETEAGRIVQELKHKNVEASRTIDELRAQKMGSDKVAEVYYSRIANLDKSILKFETRLSKMLSVDVEDFPNLVNEMDDCALTSNHSKGEENGNATSPKVRATCDNSAGSQGVGLSQKGGVKLAHLVVKEDDASVVCTYPCSVPAVAKSCGTFQDDEGQKPGVKVSVATVMQSGGGEVPTGKTQPPCSVIVICDSDDETDPVDTTTHIPSTSSGLTTKRNRAERIEDSPVNSTAKRERSTFAQPSRCSSLPSRV
ncbi:hypothetical protein C2S53_018573 [Perilla frutescens var. hirtella]|uniref:Uncharacterized protein n=1 Tax=Perilla frutescens var. hirtella TaxID=608512 RepID=A0AAD4IM68_PERFH|nr:hypothetical protein C2S53_018573 [Perilla frutescens var. hirtella]KAH6805122.1 hypothetical protein C2S51_029953 [Perilla frutescens var. frutescens]